MRKPDWCLLLLFTIVLLTPRVSIAKDKLAVMDLKAKHGVKESLAEGLSVVIRDTIHSFGDYEVMSKDDVEVVADRTTLRQKLGCDDTQCLINIGKSLGTKFMVAGAISKFGDTYNLSLRLIETTGKDPGVRKRTNRNCRCSEDELIQTATVVAGQLMEKEEHPSGQMRSTGVEQLHLMETRGYFVDNPLAGQLFVIEGRVRNEFAKPRRSIHLRAKLYTSDGETARQLDFYAGNVLSDKQLRSMSLGDLLGLIQRPPTAHQKERVIAAQEEVSFTVPFGNLHALTQLSDYSIEIMKSQAVSSAEDRKTFTNSIGMEFVSIPSGSFMMGSNSLRSHEKPVHKVTITRPFYLQTTEVTQGQWRRVMGNNTSSFKNCGDDCPVELVSWDEVQEFIRKLNQMENTYKYRLPTEAEWEYACRAGTKTPFHTGNCISTDQANYNGNDPQPNCPKGIYRETTVRVGSFQPNAWGLYDMHGNVWEWCHDWYDEKYYSRSPERDPKGPSIGKYRVWRGGSFWDGAVESAVRKWHEPGTLFNHLGFRVARTF